MFFSLYDNSRRLMRNKISRHATMPTSGSPTIMKAIFSLNITTNSQRAASNVSLSLEMLVIMCIARLDNRRSCILTDVMRVVYVL